MKPGRSSKVMSYEEVTIIITYSENSRTPTPRADNFEMTGEGKDEITLEGFLALHVMTAEDEEGGEEELWEVLSTLGYSRQLQLDQVPRTRLL